MLKPIETTGTLAATQTQLRLLVAEDKLGVALSQLQQYTSTHQLQGLLDLTVQQAGRWAEYQKSEIANVLSFEQRQQMKAQITMGILQIINSLDTKQNNALNAKPKGMKADTFRGWLFGLLLLSKLLLFLFVFTHWEAGGLAKGEFMIILSLLIPVFVGYAFLMSTWVFQKQSVETKMNYYPLQHLFWCVLVLAIYTGLVMLVVGMESAGSLTTLESTDCYNLTSFAVTASLLAAIESVFSILVGQVVVELSRNEK